MWRFFVSLTAPPIPSNKETQKEGIVFWDELHAHHLDFIMGGFRFWLQALSSYGSLYSAKGTSVAWQQ